MTDATTAKILRWLGTWPTKCRRISNWRPDSCECPECGAIAAGPHDIPMPQLTDADAMACLRKLAQLEGNPTDPADDIFAAALVHIDSLEQYSLEQAKNKCPTCDSPNPRLHPAVQYEGELHMCADNFHTKKAE